MRYSWTAGGRLRTRQWTRGLVTTYGYNAAGELESVQYSGGAVGYTNRYDRRGRLIEVVQGPATLRRWSSAAGELISESWTGGELDGVRVTNLVDSLGRRTAQEVWRGTQRLSRVDYTWGGADRLLSVSDELGHRADYEWEPLAPVVRLTTTRGFDTWNRLTFACASSSAAWTPHRRVLACAAEKKPT